MLSRSQPHNAQCDILMLLWLNANTTRCCSSFKLLLMNMESVINRNTLAWQSMLYIVLLLEFEYMNIVVNILNLRRQQFILVSWRMWRSGLRVGWAQCLVFWPSSSLTGLHRLHLQSLLSILTLVSQGRSTCSKSFNGRVPWNRHQVADC